MSKVIDYYVYMFPQLTLPIKNGIKDTEEYKNIVLRGIFPDDLSFPMETSGLEELIEVNTPIGITPVLYLPDRLVFERFVKCLGHKNEDIDIPKTTGAIYISGLNNWRKIYAHKDEFMKTHNEDEWNEEFARFTSDKANFKDTVLLISKGNYSAVSFDKVSLPEDKWLDISKNIRIYHEITHKISRTLYPTHQEAVRDEVIADAIGIYYALGKYDSDIALKVLGIYDGKYVDGGRLENYIEKTELNKSVDYCIGFITKLKNFFSENIGQKPFDLLLKIEDDYIR